MVWDGLVAVDLFFAGLGAWTFIVTMLATRGNAAGEGSDRVRKVKLVGFAVAIVAVALGALILAVDAKGGFLHPMRYFSLLGNFGSVMTWGVVLISLFLVGAFVAAIMLFMKKQVPSALEWVVAALALGVSLYTGVLLGTAGAYPLWNLIALPLSFVVSAAYTGYAAYGLVAQFVGKGEVVAPKWFGKAALALPILEAVAIALVLAFASMVQGSGMVAAAGSVANLMSGSYALLFWGGVVLVGLVLPLVCAVMRSRRLDAPAMLGTVEWIAILVGGFAFRYVIIMAAVPIFG